MSDREELRSKAKVEWKSYRPDGMREAVLTLREDDVIAWHTARLNEARKHIAWVEPDRSGANHLFIGDEAVSSHEPNLCPECIEMGSLQGDK